LHEELERTTDAEAKHAEPVLAGLDIQVGPGLAVYLNHVAIDTGDLFVRLRVPERTISGVVVVATSHDTERDLILACWKTDRLLLSIFEDVKASKAIVDILRSVVNRVVLEQWSATLT